MDPEPKRTKTTSVTDNENLADRMDEDNFRRGPATSHQLEPVDDENVSKKAQVVRNVGKLGRTQTWLFEQATKAP